MDTKDKKNGETASADSKPKKPETFTGKVAVEVLKVGTKKKTIYKRGDEFSTTDEKVFKSLINRKKIKAQ